MEHYKEFRRWTRNNAHVTRCIISRDRSYIMCAAGNRLMKYDINTHKTEYSKPGMDIETMDMSLDESLVVTSGRGNLTLWQTKRMSGAEFNVLSSYRYDKVKFCKLMSAANAPYHIISARSDGKILLWDTDGNKIRAFSYGLYSGTHSCDLAVFSTINRFAYASKRGVEIFQIENGATVGEIDFVENGVNVSCTLSADDRILVVCDESSKVRIIDAILVVELRILTTFGTVLWARFFPHTDHILMVMYGELKLANITSGDLIQSWALPSSDYCRDITLSKDGSTMAMITVGGYQCNLSVSMPLSRMIPNFYFFQTYLIQQTRRQKHVQLPREAVRLIGKYMFNSGVIIDPQM